MSHSFDKILGVEHCSATTGGVLDHAIDAEDEEHQDFLRLVRPNFDSQGPLNWQFSGFFFYFFNFVIMDLFLIQAKVVACFCEDNVVT